MLDPTDLVELHADEVDPVEKAKEDFLHHGGRLDHMLLLEGFQLLKLLLEWSLADDKSGLPMTARSATIRSSSRSIFLVLFDHFNSHHDCEEGRRGQSNVEIAKLHHLIRLRREPLKVSIAEAEEPTQ